MLSIETILNQALQLHKAGRLKEAATLYRQVLLLQPDQPDATHLLGLTALHDGDTKTAIGLITRAAARMPKNPAVQYNLGNAYAAAGVFHEAASAFERATRLAPDYVEAHANRGVALARLKRFDMAIRSLRRAIALNPSYGPAHLTLATALAEQGSDSQALESYDRAIALGVATAEARLGRARVLLRRGQRDEAIESIAAVRSSPPPSPPVLREIGALLFDCGLSVQAEHALKEVIKQAPDDVPSHLLIAAIAYADGRHADASAALSKAIALDPMNVEAHNRLGALLLERGDLDGAQAQFERAISARDDFAEAHCNLGVVAAERHQLQAAIEHYRRALSLKSDLPEAHNNLAQARQARGEIGAAIEGFSQALALNPHYAVCHSNLVFALNYDPAVSTSDILAAHRRWAEVQTAGLIALPPVVRAPQRDSRLRLGFVSADFRNHPVGYFLLGPFAHLDRSRFEIACYSNVSRPDAMTALLREGASRWRDVVGLPAERLAELIRSDGVDILIDLSGHTLGNRLLAFAYRPAPLQLTWAGYVGTTGLDAIDFLVADRFHVPEGSEQLYVERILRLPDGYVCYTPPPHVPPVAALPALGAAHVTFGCFSIPSKINDQVLDVWANLLSTLPKSQLLLKYRGMEETTFQTRVRTKFEAHRIDPARVQIEGGSSHADLLARYNTVDIALDTFPYSGGLTTLEALWMGVPVVTWPGERFASRHSLSHLSNVGLVATIARDRDEYIAIATNLAQDLDRLAEIRKTLRARMAASPVCDAERFTRNLEVALYAAWDLRRSRGST